jgi:hypothetical protein
MVVCWHFVDPRHAAPLVTRRLLQLTVGGRALRGGSAYALRGSRLYLRYGVTSRRDKQASEGRNLA